MLGVLPGLGEKSIEILPELSEKSEEIEASILEMGYATRPQLPQATTEASFDLLAVLCNT